MFNRLSVKLNIFYNTLFGTNISVGKNDFTEFELKQINDAISDYFVLRNDVLKTGNLTEALCDSTISNLTIISTDRINYNKNCWKI